MHPFASRPWIAAGVITGALAGAGGMAFAPATASPPNIRVADVALTADQDILLEFVRHGLSTDNVNLINGTVAPGAPLFSPYGFQQAQAVGQELFDKYGADGVDGIFASGLIRTQETAAPFADLMDMNVTNLSGLNEINAGIFEGIQASTVDEFKNTALMYLAAPILWTYGLYSVPLLGSSDFNGMAFDARFDGAVQTIYDTSMNAADPTDVDVAFSHGAAIMIWTMMNVDNPDPMLMLEHPLTNTSQVVIEGNPTDGWTLVNWDGVDVPAADLSTALFVDFRDLIVAPQMAAYQIQEALLTLDPTRIMDAVQTGFTDVFNAIVAFPTAVWDDIVGAVGDGTGSLAADAASSWL